MRQPRKKETKAVQGNDPETKKQTLDENVATLLLSERTAAAMDGEKQEIFAYN
jgi:hypothetical protein